MGKAYSNRKKESERPLNDFYPTPSCMVLELIENGFLENKFDDIILDPCCGKYAIGNVLRTKGYKNLIEKDLFYGNDFLTEDKNGKVECGMMITGWFIWNRCYNGLPKIKVLDMQKYIKGKK